MSRSVAFLLVLCASCMLAGTSLAQQPTDSVPKVASQPVEIQSADRVEWRKRILAIPRPTAGCFTVKYPSEKWEVTPCGTPRDLFHQWLPNLPKAPSQTSAGFDPAVAGIGHEFVATAVGGPITSAEGFFPQAADVQTVTSVQITNGKTSDAAGAYSLQLNANASAFSTPAACANAQDPSVCQGWVQFLFMNDPKGSFAGMELWLFNFGPTCPGQGSIPQLPGMPTGLSWTATSGNCTFYDETPSLPSQPITQLGQLRLRAEALAGGQDSVTITLPDGSISGVAISDELLKLASVWTQAQFNALGYVNGQRAWFNDGAALVVQVNVENGTANPPTISMGGISIESNNLHLVSPGCPNGGNPPNIVFEEVSFPYQVSQSCPPPPIPPPPDQCALAKSAITGLQDQLAKAQALLNGPTCTGTAHFDCERTVQGDQIALTAAIAHKNQVCTP
jgi:hypothetical protein